MDLQAVITSNREQRRRARSLNVRAGEKDSFLVMNQEQFGRWLAERLGNARCPADIQDPAVLLLPALDEELVTLVMSDNPDEIPILDRLHRVEYPEGSAPKVRLDESLVAAHAWQRLPDDGVKLPGGRSVEISINIDQLSISGRDIPALKVQARKQVNQRQWDNWPTKGRPVIALPDTTDPTSVVPDIIECPYGVSIIDGSALVAFGAIVVVKSYRYSSDPWFKNEWFQARTEAEAARTESIAKLESLREEAIKQRQLDDAKVTAEAVQESLRSIQSREGWYDLDDDLRSRVDSRCHEYLPSGLEDLQTWRRATNALIGEVEAAFKARAGAKAAEDARIAAAEKSGHLVRELEVTCDTRYSRGHVWVIQPDGTTREHDGYGKVSSRRYTSYAWSMISDELVIVSDVESVQGGGLITSGTGIVWRPQQVTSAQIAKIERLERENGLGDTFEIDLSLVAKKATPQSKPATPKANVKPANTADPVPTTLDALRAHFKGGVGKKR